MSAGETEVRVGGALAATAGASGNLTLRLKNRKVSASSGSMCVVTIAEGFSITKHAVVVERWIFTRDERTDGDGDGGEAWR